MIPVPVDSTVIGTVFGELGDDAGAGELPGMMVVGLWPLEPTTDSETGAEL